MEAGNRKLFAKDLTSVALTSQHKRGVIGAFVEGKLKMYDKPKTTNKENNSSNSNSQPSTRGGGRGGNRGRGGARGRGGSNRGRGGGPKPNNTSGTDNSKPDNKKNSNAGRENAPKQRGEPLPVRSKKKLVDRIQDPHVQAIIRDQLESGEPIFFAKNVIKKLTKPSLHLMFR